MVAVGHLALQVHAPDLGADGARQGSHVELGGDVGDGHGVSPHGRARAGADGAARSDLRAVPGHTAPVVEVLCPVVVGRDAELAGLRRALVAAERGAGGLVTVVGEPGIGKSRLVREVVDGRP